MFEVKDLMISLPVPEKQSGEKTTTAANRPVAVINPNQTDPWNGFAENGVESCIPCTTYTCGGTCSSTNCGACTNATVITPGCTWSSRSYSENENEVVANLDVEALQAELRELVGAK